MSGFIVLKSRNYQLNIGKKSKLKIFRAGTRIPRASELGQTCERGNVVAPGNH